MNENAESRKAEGENLLREACCEERDCLVACSERMKDNLQQKRLSKDEIGENGGRNVSRMIQTTIEHRFQG